MTELSQTILDRFQVRKTKAQKTAFIRFMQQQIPELTVEEGGFGSSRNLIVGDVSSAKTVLTAHYDTCAVLPVPNLIFPKNIVLSLLYGVLLALPMLILSGVFTWLFDQLAVSGLISGQLAFLFSELMLLVLLAAFIGLLYFGKANRHTVDDNTSGVLLLCELYAAMTEEQKKKTALVFFDNEEMGLLGSAYFRKRHRSEMKDKLLINFDCISDGDTILLIPNRKTQKRWGHVITAAYSAADGKTVSVLPSSRVFYPSDQAGFPYAVGAAAFRRSALGLYLGRIHTPRDTVLDETNLTILRDGTLKLLSSGLL